MTPEGAPKPPEDVYLTYAGPIDTEAVKKFFKAFGVVTQQQAKRVHFLLHSDGGTVTDGLAIYNFLRGLKIEIIMYNPGSVSSIAVLIYLAGNKRLVSGNASFLLHKSTNAFSAPATVEAMETSLEVVRRNDDVIESVWKSHISLPPDKAAIHAIRNLTITAKEAVDFKLANEVRNWNLPQGEMCYPI